MSVQVVATKKNIAAGLASVLINMFDGKDTGYVKLESKSLDFTNPSWPKIQTRVSTFKGKKEVLQAVVDQAKANKEKGVPSIPGNLQIREVLATEIPDDLRSLFFDKTKDEEENIQQYSKRAGSAEDAPVLSVGDVPILRFTVYDSTGGNADVTIAHDNVEEVQQYRQSTVGQEANLPG